MHRIVGFSVIPECVTLNDLSAGMLTRPQSTRPRPESSRPRPRAYLQDQGRIIKAKAVAEAEDNVLYTIVIIVINSLPFFDI